MRIERRAFLQIASALIAARPALAQSPKVPVVAVLVPVSSALADFRVSAIRKGLAEAGLVEGTHFTIALRFAEGRAERLPGLAKELQSLSPVVFVTGGNGLTPAWQLEPRPPIVFTGIAIDPVALGFAQSYAHPGGMVTGNVLNALGCEDPIVEKRFGLFKELVPDLKRLAMFGPRIVEGKTGFLYAQEVRAADRAASRYGFQALSYQLGSIDDLESALQTALRDGADSLYVSGEPLLISNLSRAAPMIATAGKPTLGAYVEWARAGILMTYSADLQDGMRRAGLYAAKIIQGSKPGDLPIEQPSKFTLAINLKAARQLGISVPAPIEASADELIE